MKMEDENAKGVWERDTKFANMEDFSFVSRWPKYFSSDM